MESNSRLYSQVAAVAGVPIERAMVGCYFSDLRKAGKTLDDAAGLMRFSRSAARSVARDWGLEFPDYVPGNPTVLQWEQERRGKWILKSGRLIVAEAMRVTENGHAEYRARSIPDGLTATGSDAEVACRRLSLQIEEHSTHAVQIDDVEIRMPGFGVLAPKAEPNAPKMRQALNA